MFALAVPVVLAEVGWIMMGIVDTIMVAVSSWASALWAWAARSSSP